MSRPSKAAMCAAEAHFGHKVCKPNATEFVFVNQLAETIDRETGLPELIAALTASKRELECLCRQAEAKGYTHGGPTRAIQVATEALRKAGEL